MALSGNIWDSDIPRYSQISTGLFLTGVKPFVSKPGPLPKGPQTVPDRLVPPCPTVSVVGARGVGNGVEARAQSRRVVCAHRHGALIDFRKCASHTQTH